VSRCLDLPEHHASTVGHAHGGGNGISGCPRYAVRSAASSTRYATGSGQSSDSETAGSAPLPRTKDSAACSRVLLHSGNGPVFAHRCYFGFAEANSGEEQVDEIGRERFWGGSGTPRSGFFRSWTHAQNVA
jgi:hypothetical protein